MSLLDAPLARLDGTPGTLRDLTGGRPALLVNVASKCGLTPQYTALETLHEEYAAQGFTVVGLPCNQFGGQEPGDADKIAEFCKVNFGVTFPLMQKVDVNGSGADPLFERLKADAPGLMGSKAVKWNFTKFLVDREGRTVRRYAPTTKPEDLVKDIEALL